MKTPITTLLFVIVFVTSSYGQFLNHDIGVSVGSTSLQSDYGERGNFDSEWRNNGFTFALSHHLSLYNHTIRWDPNDILRNHLTIKTELRYLSNTTLRHFGEWVKPKRQSEGANQLRGMKGTLNKTSVSVNLDIHLKPLEEFVHPYTNIKVNPYITGGVSYSFFNVDVASDLGQGEEFLFEKFRGDALVLGKGEALSVQFGLGTKYKIRPKIDLFAQFAYQYFFSDELDGLNAVNDPSNKNNEWLLNFQFGVILHLNYNNPLFY